MNMELIQSAASDALVNVVLAVIALAEMCIRDRIYTLGLALAADCPDNDCRVYLNIFNGARELDAALDNLDAVSYTHLDVYKRQR